MNMAFILSVKGSDVVSTQPHRTLAEAAALLASRGIGAVIVSGGDGEILGILSERDIVRAIGRDGAAALGEPVSRHMTARVVTARPESTVEQVMDQMTALRFRHMPVIDNGRLAGIVSIGDVVKWRVEDIETEHRAMREYIAHA